MRLYSISYPTAIIECAEMAFYRGFLIVYAAKLSQNIVKYRNRSVAPISFYAHLKLQAGSKLPAVDGAQIYTV
jgi:hypothetical protein